jgi:hypothetical protein
LLITSNLSAERKKMPLAGVNIARVVALVVVSVMQLMLLRLLLLVVTELLEGFKRLVSTQEDLDLVETEQPCTGTIDF